MFKIIYRLYKKRLLDEFVRDMYADIPKDLAEPSIEFLAKGREKLEKFYRIHAYNIQRRAVADAKNAQVYQGMLIEIKAILVVIANGKIEPELRPIKQEKKKENPIDGVNSFVENAKKLVKDK